ncbi:hypothetical protein NX033_19565 [Escherichia coli]|uniref:hypothetical protein n=1 Tax=Escherichia coli TaxID=562 RepID=UPI00050B334F|nr:hypothetical protein [Escherichia coli]MBT9746958.1 hypothetical protein [Enterobacteriaceae bacterium MCC505]KUH20580.1 hypothetical protein ARC89_12425 [Escherichia coli]MCS1361680.1 hypothetical protein [Escherichia coli]MVW37199.1 hypothetical protein [Escherichia coli]MWK28911.1 hypothetical protein [Escherichia coli]
MEILGNHKDKFQGIQFLHSAIEELNEKTGVTLTDYLALRAFVLAERRENQDYIDAMDAPYADLPDELRSYIELLNDVAAQLSNPARSNGDLRSIIYDARISSGNAVSHWLNVER